jgi:glycosyltransferase involved in cell wall biosynthesis
MNEPAARVPSRTLSIIVPTRNRAGLLRRALESITAQTATDVEILVVDDGSRDDTAQTAREFASVRYYRNAVSSGASTARNRGAAMARGDWLLFL